MTSNIWHPEKKYAKHAHSHECKQRTQIHVFALATSERRKAKKERTQLCETFCPLALTDLNLEWWKSVWSMLIIVLRCGSQSAATSKRNLIKRLKSRSVSIIFVHSSELESSKSQVTICAYEIIVYNYVGVDLMFDCLTFFARWLFCLRANIKTWQRCSLDIFRWWWGISKIFKDLKLNLIVASRIAAVKTSARRVST